MKTFATILSRNWLGLLIALIFAYLLFQRCEAEKDLLANIKDYKIENTVYKNKIGTLTMQNNTLQLANEDLQNTVLKADEKIKALSKGFKEIKFVTRTKTVTKIDTISTIFEKPIPCSFVREGSISKEWFSLKYKIDSTSLKIDSLTIPNEQIIVSGLKSNGFLKRKSIITEVTNTNPNIQNTSFQSYLKKDEVKFYDTTVFKLFVGGLAGAIIKNQL